MTASDRRVAVVGAGWAGLAAAIVACRRGHSVTVFEMAARPGGRARSVDGETGSPAFDSGQHILIGAYTETLRLLEAVGVDTAAAFLRTPLALRYPDGEGLVLGSGPPGIAFARAVLGRRGWSVHERFALLAAAAGWALRGFSCPAEWTVARLARGLPAAVRADLVEPLCVASLNTPASDACARTFLRVLRDALGAGPGSADLLLPRVALGELLPTAALRWLAAKGATLATRCRVASLSPTPDGWMIDGGAFDAVIVATGGAEAARLAAPIAPAWGACAAALAWEPIATVYVDAAGHRLAAPMLMLRADALKPAQFAFDLGQLGGPPGRLALVISGAADWVREGREAMVAAVLEQARGELLPPNVDAQPVQVLVDKRATFRCTPQLARPAARIAQGLHAAGDYVAGPYPATLEGAVRSGLAAARAVGG